MSRYAIFALLAAALFGSSTPAAKALIGSTDPVILAGLLYCGAGVGMAVLRRIVRLLGAGAAGSPLGRAEIPWLGGSIVAGGIVAPVLLMYGLIHTDASTASLLLSLEGVATSVLAWLVFRESFDRRIAFGMVFIVAGAMVLSGSGGPSFSSVLGPLTIIGACAAWGLDNNFTRTISDADPLQIVEIKSLVAGAFNLALGIWAGGALPTLPATLVSGLIGFLGYGVSLGMFVLALRHLGAAKTGAYFSAAPFLGAVAAILFLGEPVTGHLVIAGLLIAAGVWLI